MDDLRIVVPADRRAAHRQIEEPVPEDLVNRSIDLTRALEAASPRDRELAEGLMVYEPTELRRRLGLSTGAFYRRKVRLKAYLKKAGFKENSSDYRTA